MRASTMSHCAKTKNTLFYAPLTCSSIPKKGISGPTFTRATTATIVDFEGLVKNCLSGEIRFRNSRRVENLLSFDSEDPSSWSVTNATFDSVSKSPSGTYVAGKFSFTASNTARINFLNLPVVTGNRYTFSAWIKSDNSEQMRILYDDTGGTQQFNFTPSSSWQRFYFSITANETISTATFQIRNISATAKTVWVAFPQEEEATGQLNLTPSEYVSVGVLSDPFHGAGLDGIRYFDYETRNGIEQNLAENSGEIVSNATATDTYSNPVDGSNDATYLQENDQVAWHYKAINGTAYITLQDDTVYTASVYAKKGERNHLYIPVTNKAGTVPRAWFNLNTGIVYSESYNISSGMTEVIAPDGSTWWRCWVTYDSESGGTGPTFLCSIGESPGIGNYLGDGSSGLYLYGMQINQGSYPFDFVDNQTSAAIDTGIVYERSGPKLSDSIFWSEETRTNLLICSESITDSTASSCWQITNDTTSEVIITSNDSRAPDGYITADKIEFPQSYSGEYLLLRQSVSGLTNPSTLSPSIWIKGDTSYTVYIRQGDGSAGYEAISVTTEWQRFESTPGSNASTTFNFDIATKASGGATSSPMTLWVWGAQLEVGETSSTYIPTNASTETRNADRLSYDSNNVGDSAGSIMFDTIRPDQERVSQFINFGGPRFYTTASGNQPRLYDGTTTYTHGNTTNDNSLSKLAGWWSITTCNLYLDGVERGSDAAFDGSMNAGNFTVGVSNTGGANIGGGIKQLYSWSFKKGKNFFEKQTE